MSSPVVVMRGDFTGISGYARCTRRYVQGLYEAGVNIYCEDHRKEPAAPVKDPFWVKMLAERSVTSSFKCDIRIQHETPQFYAPNKKCFNVGYTTFECSGIPNYSFDSQPLNNWVEQCNRMDLILVPCDFNKRTFAESGVTTPIEVVPHIVDPPPEDPKPTPYYGFDPEFLRMLSVFQWNPRKDPVSLLIAFWRAELEKARLIIKTYGLGFDRDNLPLLDKMHALKRSFHKPPLGKINAMLKRLSDEEVHKLYASADVYVTSTRGEGFCLPPDTTVDTLAGPKRVQDVLEGDQVFSHTGKLRTVTGRTTRDVAEPLVAIRRKGAPEALCSTREHPHLIVRRTGKKKHFKQRAASGDLRPEWVPAGQVRPGDLAVLPKPLLPPPSERIDVWDFCPKSVLVGDRVSYPSGYSSSPSSSSLSTIALQAGCSHQYVARVLWGDRINTSSPLSARIREIASREGYEHPQPKAYPRWLDVDKRTAFVLGLYISEGSSTSGGAALEFSSHAREEYARLKTLSVLSDWGCKVRSYVEGRRGKVVASGRPVAEALSALFGDSAHTKQIPQTLLGSSHFLEIVRGVFYGDGNASSKSGTYRIDTASPKLAHDLRTGLLAHGIVTSCSIARRDGCFTLRVPQEHAERFEREVQPWKYDRPCHVAPQRTRYRYILETPNAFLLPVVAVESRPYEGPVFNLHVGEDESFTSHGMATHNCLPAVEAMMAGIPLIAPTGTAFEDYMSEEVGFPVDWEWEPVSGMENLPYGTWYSPRMDWMKVNINALTQAMRNAYKAHCTPCTVKGEAMTQLQAKGVRAREVAVSLASESVVVKKYAEILNGVFARVGKD